MLISKHGSCKTCRLTALSGRAQALGTSRTSAPCHAFTCRPPPERRRRQRPSFLPTTHSSQQELFVFVYGSLQDKQ